MKKGIRRKRYFFAILAVVILFLAGLWFFVIGPVRLYTLHSPDKQYSLSVYWAGHPLQSFIYLQGSDRDYFPGYVALWKKGSLLPVKFIALPILLFDKIEWVSNTVVIERYRPDPAIVWKCE